MNKINQLRERMKFPYFIYSKFRDEILELCKYDSNLRSALTNDTDYIFTIKIEDLFYIKPMDVMKVTRYSYLINYLKSLKIEMRIISKRKKPEVINLMTINYDTTA